MGSLARPLNARRACLKCHARKVKCSGGHPCTNCLQADVSSECTYPTAKRRVRVEQSYIDGLLDEIHLLRQANDVQKTIQSTGSSASVINPEFGSNTLGNQPSTSYVSAGPAANIEANLLQENSGSLTGPAIGPRSSIQNPMLDDRPWFHALTPEMPLLVSEATDVALATRFRQELMGSSQVHLPRVDYIQDEPIFTLEDLDHPWPPPSRSRFLLKVAFSTICRRYYLVQKSSTLQLLECAIRNPTTCDLLSACKLYALFALGEVYSTRTCLTDEQFPGLAYYVSATRMLRALSEQPRVDCVEVLIMLSLYCLLMNRRQGAYCMVGNAMRFGIITGLHLNVPKHQLPNCELREHRKRVWWTAYILDRSWACMLGKPVSIQDEDIDVDLPSMLEQSTESAAHDFADADYLTASIRIATLGARISGSVYSRRKQRTLFSSRVQEALQDLGKWLQELPVPLRAAMDNVSATPSPHLTPLYLYFNQCLISAARPILLYSLRQHLKPYTSGTAIEVSSTNETASTLSDACIQCARRSYSVLTESWINGSFPAFDFMYTQYLFSTSTILAMSSLFQTSESRNDRDGFEVTAQILYQLSQNGNFAAKEVSKHVAATKHILDNSFTQRPFDVDSNSNLRNHVPTSMHEARPSAAMAGQSSGGTFAEPPLQELLLQPGMDLGFLEQSFLSDEFEAFVWPESTSGDWTNS